MEALLAGVMLKEKDAYLYVVEEINTTLLHVIEMVSVFFITFNNRFFVTNITCQASRLLIILA